MTSLARAICVVALAAGLAAMGCGDDGGSTTAQLPQLAGTPIPTVTAPVPTAVVCDAPAPQQLPSNFPTAEVPVPPDYVVWSVATAPYLHVAGTVFPPGDPDRAPWVVASDAILQNFLDTKWTYSVNPQVEGSDFDFKSPDGTRTGHFLAHPLNINCPGVVELIYDIRWVTG